MEIIQSKITFFFIKNQNRTGVGPLAQIGSSQTHPVFPIVPVVKPDGSIRIPREYKLTVYQVSKLDIHSLPKDWGSIASLSGFY